MRAHSDAGSHCTAISYAEKLALDGIAPSIAPVGDAYDSALMETITGLHKAECVRTTVFHEGPYKTIADGEYATAGWVDWHNHRRLHGSLGMANPNEFEQAHHAALTQEPLPAQQRQRTCGSSLKADRAHMIISHRTIFPVQPYGAQWRPQFFTAYGSGRPGSQISQPIVFPRSPKQPWTPRRWTQNHHASSSSAMRPLSLFSYSSSAWLSP